MPGKLFHPFCRSRLDGLHELRETLGDAAESAPGKLKDLTIFDGLNGGRALRPDQETDFAEKVSRIKFRNLTPFADDREG